MNCEMAEDNLSAYLDDMLDSHDRADVQEHLEGCTRCREILDDYRRYDILLAQLPLVAPPDDMHARIFESPQFEAITRQQQRDQQRAGRRLAVAPPGWSKIALQAAAVVVLVFGAALLIKQGLFSSARLTSSTSTSTLGNPPTGIPLAAGNRLVFVHSNALWSALETGPGLAQQLTPHGIVVEGFTVAPDGRHVAYVDSDGAIHIIRSDGQGDATIVQGHGLQILGAPVWSPDGQQLAYAVSSLNGPALHLINSSGTNDRVVSAISAAAAAVSQFGSVRWSPDGLHVAWVQTTGGAESLWAYDLVAHATRQLVAHADSANPSASFVDLAWLPNSLQPALSWAADTFSPPTATSAASSTITGVFALPLSSGTVRRLTALGATYSGALFTAARGDGAWLLISTGSASTLEGVAADSGAVLGSTAISTSVRTGFWSPDSGSVAYVTTAGDLALWSPASGVTQHLLSGVTSFPAWSQDGSHIAAVTSNGVESVAVGTGSTRGATHLANAPAQDPVAAFWAPDGRAVVVTSPSGLLIVASDGSASKVIEQGTVTGTLAWSVAG